MWLLLLSTALAYETDQLTARTAPLTDAAPVVNELFAEALSAAAIAVNARTKCDASDARTERLVAKHVHTELSGSARLHGRGFVRGSGYGKLTVYLESDPRIERRSFLDREDIFGDATPTESFILSLAGPCSTIRIGDTLLGTDKIAHFTGLGYDYWRVSRHGRKEHKAIDYGTRTENSIYGRLTSTAFSWADLRANYDGYQFYLDLLTPRGALIRDAEGCVVPNKPVRFDKFVDWQYDEVLNPSRYGPKAEAAIQRRLATETPAICAEYQQWGAEGFRIHRDTVMSFQPPYAGERAPERVDPFQLPERCAQ